MLKKSTASNIFRMEGVEPLKKNEARGINSVTWCTSEETFWLLMRKLTKISSNKMACKHACKIQIYCMHADYMSNKRIYNCVSLFIY